MKNLAPPDFKLVLVRKLEIIHPSVSDYNNSKKLVKEMQSKFSNV